MFTPFSSCGQPKVPALRSFDRATAEVNSGPFGAGVWWLTVVAPRIETRKKFYEGGASSVGGVAADHRLVFQVRFETSQEERTLVERTVIFVTWDGSQTNYLESLFLPVFVELVPKGFDFRVLQLTWARSERVSSLRKRCQEHGIGYRYVPVLRSPRGFGQVLSILGGALQLRRELREAGKSTVLFRSIMGALVVKLSRVPSVHFLVYDSDGLPIDERVDFSNLKQDSLLHRLLVDVESWALTASSAVLARSEFGKQVLVNRISEQAAETPVHVISNGRIRRDQDCLPTVRAQDVIPTKPLSICYVGSWGAPYDPVRILDLVKNLRASFAGATFHIFTGDSSRVAADLATEGLAEVDWISVGWSEVSDLSKDLLGFDIGLALRKTTVSTRATSPMKLGSYLASGVAVVGDQIGDESTYLAANNAMFLLEENPTQELYAWIEEFVLSDRATRFERCQQLAIEKFSITESATQYANVLKL